MSEVHELLERIRREARQRTRERIRGHGRDVNVLLFLLISEVYSLETLLEELLTALDELRKRYG